MFTLRDARHEDIAAIARLHADVWRHTYRDHAPPEVMRARSDVAWRRERWRALLALDQPGTGTILAEVDGALAGFGHYGPADAPVLTGLGEVKKLNVATALARRGIGRALLGAMAERLRALGHRAVGLGVLADNAPARAFYEAMGGVVAARYVDPVPEWPCDIVVYAWHDFDALARRVAG